MRRSITKRINIWAVLLSCIMHSFTPACDDSWEEWEKWQASAEGKLAITYIARLKRSNLGEIEKLFIPFEEFKKQYTSNLLSERQIKRLYLQRKHQFLLLSKQLSAWDFLKIEPRVTHSQFTKDNSHLIVYITYGVSFSASLPLVFQVTKTEDNCWFTGSIETVGRR